MKQILVTAGVIINDDKLLLAQRLPQGAEEGKWEFPGGKVEPGEEPRVCLKRELQEELGILVEVGEIIDLVSEVRSDGIHLVLLYFYCKIVSGQPQGLENQNFLWSTPEDIDKLEKLTADKAFWDIHKKELSLSLK